MFVLLLLDVSILTFIFVRTSTWRLTQHCQRFCKGPGVCRCRDTQNRKDVCHCLERDTTHKCAHWAVSPTVYALLLSPRRKIRHEIEKNKSSLSYIICMTLLLSISLRITRLLCIWKLFFDNGPCKEVETLVCLQKIYLYLNPKDLFNCQLRVSARR